MFSIAYSRSDGKSQTNNLHEIATTFRKKLQPLGRNYNLQEEAITFRKALHPSGRYYNLQEGTTTFMKKLLPSRRHYNLQEGTTTVKKELELSIKTTNVFTSRFFWPETDFLYSVHEARSEPHHLIVSFQYFLFVICAK